MTVMSATAPTNLPIDDLRIDGGTQSRARIDDEVVAEYAGKIRAGAQFPPVVAFFDGVTYWLADGFHRWHAHRAAGFVAIAVDARSGSCRDAQLFSLGANADHGLRRTNADKRKSVETVIRDPEWGQRSNAWIAEVCKVSDKTVASIREDLERRSEIRTSTQRTDSKGRNQPAKKEKPPKPAKDTVPPGESAPAPAKSAGAGKKAKDPNQMIAEQTAEIGRLNGLLAELQDERDEARQEAARLHTQVQAAEAVLAGEHAKRILQLEAELDSTRRTRDDALNKAAETLKQVKILQKQLGRK